MVCQDPDQVPLGRSTRAFSLSSRMGTAEIDKGAPGRSQS